MTFSVHLKSDAEKAFLKLERDTQKRILKKLQALAINPTSSGAVKLQGYDFYRVRIGDYRVVYELLNDKLIILVVRIAHRRDIYRDL